MSNEPMSNEPMLNEPMRVTGMDHIVLVVHDVESVVTWYHEELGLALVRMEEWRRDEVPFPSLRINDSTIIDVIVGDRTGENVNHVALVVEDVDIDELAQSGRFVVEAGPADLFGARGTGRGIYTRDPAGNLVELRSYAACATAMGRAPGTESSDGCRRMAP